jgi:hypothetical protein
LEGALRKTDLGLNEEEVDVDELERQEDDKDEVVLPVDGVEGDRVDVF